MLFHPSEIAMWLKIYAAHVSLGWFVLTGSFLEEVISPIPAMLITGIAGSIALIRNDAWWQILLLGVLASIGKSLGAWFYYIVGDAGEYLLSEKIGKWFGVTHADIKRVGAHFTGNHWKDGGALFLTRVLPFMPTTPFSLAAGIFKMDILVYLLVTFIGYFIKDTGYILAGYFGFAKISTLWREINHVKFVFDIAVTIAIVTALFLLYRHRHRGQHIWRQVCRFFDRKD